MSEKYYVVSESELHALIITSEITFKRLPRDNQYDLEDCFEACRAHPVEPIGTQTDELGTSQLWREEIRR